MQLGLGLGTGNDISLFILALKVTNTFVLPSWPESYLAGANQWVWHRKHVTTVTESVGVAQEARDHSYFRTRSVVNNVHPIRNVAKKRQTQ